MKLRLDEIPGLKVTVMGLGLHGGGIASARFFASLGAEVLITDLRSPEILASSVKALDDLPVNFRLGEHRNEDFSGSDLVIKNPAVPPGSRYLKLAGRISSDIAVFLGLTRRRVFAITGTKGKSTTASAVAHVLKKVYPDADLGGNITVSPLTFLLDHIENGRINEPASPVVLELSSWQLADCIPREVLHPEITLITNIMHDHQNRYDTFQDYVDDKKQIFLNQTATNTSIFNYDDEYGRLYAESSPGKILFFSSRPLPEGLNGSWLKDNRGVLRRNRQEEYILPEKLALPGAHNRLNLLSAGVMLASAGISPEVIRAGLSGFPGIPHRLEQVAEVDGVLYVNDSAATIPQATAAAVGSFTGPVRLIAGGTDKELDFTGLPEALGRTAGLYLLEGDATPRFQKAAQEADIAWKGPFDSLLSALETARNDSRKGDTILLSPGCASFGMFKNEFDRGDQFRELVNQRRRRLK